jgi:hypothetical protein
MPGDGLKISSDGFGPASRYAIQVSLQQIPLELHRQIFGECCNVL